ncbi:MAG: hypothetical protein HKO98_15960 [Gemmatimonadetes bacterium]|nr:hypothetical protein [Gemmatimonadota bacterium]
MSLMSRKGSYVGLLLLGLAIAHVAEAEAEPTTIGFLTPADQGGAHLESLRETARSALKRKGISAERVDFACEPDAACMRDALRGAGVSIGLYIWVWEPTEDRPEAVVGAMLKEAGGVAGFDEVAEERSCSAPGCPGVMAALVEELLARWPERAGTRVRLTGTPRGAAVFDGASLVGTVPGEFLLRRGEHRLRIAKKGYEPAVVLVEAGLAPKELRRVELVPLVESNGPVDGARRRRAAMIATGVALLMGGGALIGLGGASYRRSGGCEGTMPCQSYTTTNAGAGVMIGFGVASVGGGLGLLIRGIRNR